MTNPQPRSWSGPLPWLGEGAIVPDMLRELAERTDDGARVRLLWDDEGDRIVVRYRDPRTGEEFTAEVPGADALDAFRHPHAYRHGTLQVG